MFRFLSFPKQLNDFEVFGYKSDKGPGIPLDSLITNLAESAYVVSRSLIFFLDGQIMDEASFSIRG